jgi:hypothetical protein
MVCGQVRVDAALNDNRCWAAGSIASRDGVKLPVCRSTQRRTTEMTKSLKRPYSLLSIALPALFLACGGDSTSPADMAVGNYTAVEFVSTSSSGQKNEILAGSTVVLNLNADGTTSGHFHFVISATSSYDADMAGTWTRAGTTVDINQSADTFVRDMPFELTPHSASAWDLVGDKIFSGTRIQITLRRS